MGQIHRSSPARTRRLESGLARAWHRCAARIDRETPCGVVSATRFLSPKERQIAVELQNNNGAIVKRDGLGSSIERHHETATAAVAARAQAAIQSRYVMAIQ